MDSVWEVTHSVVRLEHQRLAKSNVWPITEKLRGFRAIALLNVLSKMNVWFWWDWCTRRLHVGARERNEFTAGARGLAGRSSDRLGARALQEQNGFHGKLGRKTAVDVATSLVELSIFLNRGPWTRGSSLAG